MQWQKILIQIRVNSILPGLTNTPSVQGCIELQGVQALLKQTPKGQMAGTWRYDFYNHSLNISFRSIFVYANYISPQILAGCMSMILRFNLFFDMNIGNICVVIQSTFTNVNLS